MAPRQRRSARVILLSPINEILLIKFSVMRSNGVFAFWAAPGGEIEDSENDAEAARRELREELRLDLALGGPVHTRTAEFEHNGERVQNLDVFFVSRCERDAPRLQAFTEEERATIRDWRWWTAAEIAATRENIFPEDLAELLQRLIVQY